MNDCLSLLAAELGKLAKAKYAIEVVKLLFAGKLVP